MARTIVDENVILSVLKESENKWYDRLEEKGIHSFSSTHEILGIVDEEHSELKDAVRSNNKIEVRNELLDIVVACLHGIASLDKGVDW